MSDTKLQARPLKWEKCRCGHRSCSYQQISNFGAFYQGTGFEPDEVDLLDRAMAALIEKENSAHPEKAKESPVGKWLSAALDDPYTCPEFKADIEAWFRMGEPAPAASAAPPEKAKEAGDMVLVPNSLTQVMLDAALLQVAGIWHGHMTGIGKRRFMEAALAAALAAASSSIPAEGE